MLFPFPCRLTIIVVGCFLTGFHPLQALEAKANVEYPLEQYLRKLWQTEQGLPQNFVTTLCQTRDGYVWLGTQQGVARFDGVQFMVFDKGNSPLKSNDISALTQDRNGGLWIATAESGAVRYAQGTFSESRASVTGLASDEITAMATDSAGGVWFGSLDKGVSRLYQGKVTQFNTNAGLLHNRVNAIFVGRSGRVWIGTSAGVNYWDGSELRSLPIHQLLGVPHNISTPSDIKAITEHSSGELWLGTDSGLVQVHTTFKTAIHFTTKQGLVNNRIRSLLCDADGMIWIGTRENGLSRYNYQTFSSLTPANGLPSGFVCSLLADREGSLWAGMLDGGLMMMRKPRVRGYTTSDGLANNVVFSVAQASDGSIWAGTLGSGVSRIARGLSGEKWISYSTSQGLADNTIWSLAPDNNGGMWLGTYYGGASYFKDGVFTTYSVKNGLVDNTVWAILPDRSGAVWFGTPKGLTCIAHKQTTTYTTQHGLPGNTVWSVFEDSKGVIWVGTDKGAAYLQNGIFMPLPAAEGLSENDVRSFMEDSSGVLWLGTASGLVRMKDGKSIAINSKQGLFDGMVYSIVSDNRGYIWMSHSKGVSRVRLQELHAVADKKEQFLTTLQTYGIADGMKTAECNGGTQASAWRSRDGRLWFATSKGLAVFDPDNLAENLQQPSVLLERILADGRAYTGVPQISFVPGISKYEFHYTSPSFRAPERVRFKYMIEGYDHEWTEAGNRRTAYYTNLPHDRHYTFRVRACNDDGVWNEVGISQQFYIAPYFYETWWFYAICSIVFVGASMGVFRLRAAQLRQRAAELERLVEAQTRQITAQAEREYQAQLELERVRERDRISQDMHDDIGATLTELSLLGELLKSDIADEEVRAPKVLERVDTITTMSRTAIDSIAEIIWTMNSRNDNIEHLSIYLRNFTARYLERAGLEYRLDFPELEVATDIRSDIRRTLLLLLKEALHNIVKHAHASAVSVRLTLNQNTLTLIIQDNGKGFDTNKRFVGHGLGGMQKRIEQAGGAYTVTSSPEKGTCIECTLPL